MFFNLATVILPLMLLGGITTATPLDVRDVKIVSAPGVDVSKLKTPTTPTSLTIAARSEESDAEKVPAPLPGGSTTSHNSAFHVLAGTAVDQFVICTSTTCSGTCYGYSLSSLQANVCYRTPVWYTSFYIYQSSNKGLPYSIFAALTSCSLPVKVPTVDSCYYIRNPDGSIRNVLQTFYRS